MHFIGPDKINVRNLLSPLELEYEIYAITCKCGHTSVCENHFIDRKLFDYASWKVEKQHKYKHSNRIQYTIDDAHRHSLRTGICPTLLLETFIAQYWNAWSYEATIQMGLEKLVHKCKKCDRTIEKLFIDKLNETKAKTT